MFINNKSFLSLYFLAFCSAARLIIKKIEKCMKMYKNNGPDLIGNSL